MPSIQDLLNQKLNSRSELLKKSNLSSTAKKAADAGKKIRADFTLLYESVKTNTVDVSLIKDSLLLLAGETILLNNQLLDLQELIANLPSVSGATKTIDYNTHIIGARDSVNKTFNTRYNFIPGTLEVHLNGILLTKGTDDDYVEVGNNSMLFTYAPLPTDHLIFHYTNTI